MHYQKPKDALLRDLDSTGSGLSAAKVKEHQKIYGPNRLDEMKSKSLLIVFLQQFEDVLVIILIAAAVISILLEDFESSVVIIVVITMNAILGTVQQQKAVRSLNSLKKLSAPTAKVMRDRTVMLIPAQEVTVGDVVLLEAGDYICADGRIIENASLKINESALTGESVSVEKYDMVIKQEAVLGDQVNMVFAGSYVTYGRGKFVVTAVGMETEVGRIASLIKDTKDKKTPLQISLDRFGQHLSAVIMIICGILFIVSILHGAPIMDSFMFAIALAVAAIPEALSSIVTIVLSFGTQKMAREQAIVRNLQAVEGLGSVSVICSDKTGTLTQNKMQVRKCYIGGKVMEDEDVDAGNALQNRFLTAGILCNDSSLEGGREIGDPTELALLALADGCHVPAARVRRQYPRLSEIPFDSERKLMSTVHRVDGRRIMYTKGAVDVLLGRMNLDGGLRREILAVNDRFSKQGLRVLALSCREVSKNTVTPEDERGLTFLGLAAMMDPPRPESSRAVEKCIQAGIKPVMITGDHKITASAVAKQIGILKDESEAVEGAQLDKLTDQELASFVGRFSVYARVSPEHKIRIVRAWQDRGNIVAMTGDGVNDAPALRQADIGIAMGRTGTEVAKDAASMVLADDNFATIVKAVENGRNVYANIKRSIQFLLSGNAAGILMVLYASLADLPVPFAPVHLLFINLLTDSLPAIALGLEPHTELVMKQKPRPRQEAILTKRFLATITLEGFIIFATTAAAFHIGLKSGGAMAGRTMAFATLCLSRLVHGFNCKSEYPVIFTKRFYNNPYLWFAFGIGVLLLGAVLLLPQLSGMFQVAALGGRLLVAIGGLALLNLWAIQILKCIRRVFFR